MLPRPCFHGLVKTLEVELVQIAQQRQATRTGQVGQAAQRERGAAGGCGGRLVRIDVWNGCVGHRDGFRGWRTSVYEHVAPLESFMFL
jgi:hypothetical protein